MIGERERGITVSVPGIQLGVMKRTLGKSGDEDSNDSTNADDTDTSVS